MITFPRSPSSPPIFPSLKSNWDLSLPRFPQSIPIGDWGIVGGTDNPLPRQEEKLPVVAKGGQAPTRLSAIAKASLGGSE